MCRYVEVGEEDRRGRRWLRSAGPRLRKAVVCALGDRLMVQLYMEGVVSEYSRSLLPTSCLTSTLGSMTECHSAWKSGWRCKNSLSLQRSRLKHGQNSRNARRASLLHPTVCGSDVNLTSTIHVYQCSLSMILFSCLPWQKVAHCCIHRLPMSSPPAQDASNLQDLYTLHPSSPIQHRRCRSRLTTRCRL